MIALPVAYEHNVGQAAPQIRFVAHARNATVALERGRAVVATRLGDRFTLRPVHSRAVEPRGEAVRGGPTHYLIGRGAHRSVRSYARVRYARIYSGIDLVYHGAEYDLELAPHARVAQIDLAVDGARRLTLDRHGRLHIRLRHRTLVQPAPVARQGARAIASRYVLRNGRIGFALGRYDHARRVTIDPVLATSAVLGGSGNDTGTAVTIDQAGNTYLAGSTTSPDLPVKGGYLDKNSGVPIDAFIAKLDAAGNVVWTTYYGGSAYTDARGIAVDAQQHVYVGGATGSKDLPVKHAVQPTYGGGPYDAYIAKLTKNGNGIIYATYDGGPHNDRGYGVALGPKDQPVLVGRTAHDGFPAKGKLLPSTEGGAFATKFSTSGRSRIYSTTLGGHQEHNSSNTAFGVAVDHHGNAYVGGISTASDYPTTKGAAQAKFGGGTSDGWVTKLSRTGDKKVYSTYIGGSGEDEVLAIAVDRSGRAFVTGQTTSGDFPVAGPGQLDVRTRAGATDADVFVAKLDAGGKSLNYSHTLGGGGEDAGNGIAVTKSGTAWLTGHTTSTDFPVLGEITGQLHGSGDAFLAAVGSDGASLGQSTYLGGANDDEGFAIAADDNGNVAVAGQTLSADFVTAGPQPPAVVKAPAVMGGGGSAWVMRVK